VDDRAYIYWHLLEIDPDIAKEMIYSEKPPYNLMNMMNWMWIL
jgi:hypothetical protein